MAGESINIPSDLKIPPMNLSPSGSSGGTYDQGQGTGVSNIKPPNIGLPVAQTGAPVLKTPVAPVTAPKSAADVASHLSDYQASVKSKLPAKTDTTAGGSANKDLATAMNAVQVQPPAVPNLEQDFLDLQNKMGVGGLTSQLNDLVKQKNDLITQLATVKNVTENTPGLTADVVGGRESEQTRQAQIKLDSINLGISTLTDQINTANSTISTIMGFEQTDYQNAKASYDTQFSQQMQVQTFLQTQKNHAQTVAAANYGVLLNAVLSGGVDPGSLTKEQVAQIDSLELQAGFPAGTFATIHENAAAAAKTGSIKAIADLQKPTAIREVVQDKGTTILGHAFGRKSVWEYYNPLANGGAGAWENQPTQEEAQTAVNAIIKEVQDQAVYDQAIVTGQ